MSSDLDLNIPFALEEKEAMSNALDTPSLRATSSPKVISSSYLSLSLSLSSSSSSSLSLYSSFYSSLSMGTNKYVKEDGMEEQGSRGDEGGSWRRNQVRDVDNHRRRGWR